MSNFLHLSLIVLAFVFSGAAFAQKAGDAVSVDPDVHHVILDNEFIRVFDARASKGATSPMHSHPSTVLVSIGDARLRTKMPDGSTGIFDLNPGQVLWIEGARHSWKLLAGELRAIGVEIKSAQKAGKPPAPTPEQQRGDAISVHPAVHHVLFENPHVRVFESRVSPGNSSPMHKHPPTLLVSLDWMRMEMTLPDGKSVIHDFSPGQVLWVGAGATHSWRALAGSGRVIGIEVKAAHAAMTK